MRTHGLLEIRQWSDKLVSRALRFSRLFDANSQMELTKVIVDLMRALLGVNLVLALNR
jgi:hypothetical protein